MLNVLNRDQRLTWVERLHRAVKETNIHSSHVDDVEQGGDDHAPQRQQNPDQNVDREQQIRQQEQINPAGWRRIS